MSIDASHEPVSVGEAWFKLARASHAGHEPRAERASAPDEGEDLGEHDARLNLGGRTGWALVLGGLGGGVGGAAMLFAAAKVAQQLHLDVDVVRTIGASAHALTGDWDAWRAGFGIAIALGGVTGVLLGGMLRYSLRLVARLLAAPLFAVALWTFVHAFVFKSLAPGSLGALPFAPMVIGAAVYGLCIAILRPPRRRVTDLT